MRENLVAIVRYGLEFVNLTVAIEIKH